MRWPFPLAALVLVACEASVPPNVARAPNGPSFDVHLGVPASVPLDGRVLLVFAADNAKEPRELVDDHDSTAQVFGLDVENARAGSTVSFRGDVIGYPQKRLEDLPRGDYWVQAVFNRYETFHRLDGRTLKLPPDRGEGQQWSLKPGNWVSEPQRIHVDPRAGAKTLIDLTRVLPELPPVPDTKYVKHITFRSPKLTAFWGRPMDLGAVVILPEGFETHPDAHYPLIVSHGHFSRETDGWRETPPDANLPAVDDAALRRNCVNGHEPGCKPAGYERMVQQAEYDFYRRWTGPGFPRVIVVQIQHPTPFYDDSYAVNSANQGPWGDAIVKELVPDLERRFRGLGPWARGMYGGSTGGWESIADQVFYPDDFNGAIANCPDPVDFHAYEVINLYEDKNAYFSEGPFRRTPVPSARNRSGKTTCTSEQENLIELATGTHSRSGGQFDAWEATYSPVGEDGYPRRIFDKATGAIDPVTAAAWRETYDLTHILERDWTTLGPKLQGKLHVNVGRLDTYFLEGAVSRLEAFLRTTKNPASDAKVDYGLTDGHCWSGDHEHPNYHSRLTYHERFIPMLVRHFVDSAPPNADVRSWRY